jgi:hypothetical protein
MLVAYFYKGQAAEITNHKGTTILRCAQLGKIDEHGFPKLHSLSNSLLKWPNQEYPPEKAWKIWKKYLYHYLNENDYLHQNLGPWNDNVQQQRKWHYVHQGQNIIQLVNDKTHLYIQAILRTCNRQK